MDQPLKGNSLHSIREQRRKPRILVAPLDWGLGHTTRCIPVVRQLLEQGFEVILAGNEKQAAIFKDEFDLPVLLLKGYNVKYGRSKFDLVAGIIRQAPGILKTIRYENKWLDAVITSHKIDAVISDNRYGLYNKNVFCVFITHQLKIKTSMGRWAERLLQKRNYRFLNKFDQVWVPDMENELKIAGELSHPVNMPETTVKYINAISRFEKKADIAESPGHLLIIISGPEPQRSIFEEIIIKQVAHYDRTATILRGLPGNASMLPSSNMIKFYNHLNTDELNSEIAKAEFIISRSGYTTVMDLVKCKKKGILVPTPGQPEQEYLGQHLLKNGIACCISQREFKLEDALKKAGNFLYKLPSTENRNELNLAISHLASILKAQ